MNKTEALQITGSLSNPSKMPGKAYGLPAKECKTGSKLAKIPGSTCSSCYALKGCYIFPVVQEAQYTRLAAIRHPLWVQAMTFHLLHQKADVFRWHDSGDVQDLKHLAKIFKVVRLTPNIKHWLPTREAWIQKYQHRAPSNLVIRFSIPMIDQKASGNWKNTSTVVTSGATCPAPNQGNACLSCRACWDPSVKNVAYGVH
jgi:hypothetical protein